MADPVTVVPVPTTTSVVKPGWKTTEFWLTTVVTVIGVLMASGIIVPGSIWDKAIGIAASTLAALGYSASRGNVKSSQ